MSGVTEKQALKFIVPFILAFISTIIVFVVIFTIIPMPYNLIIASLLLAGYILVILSYLRLI